MNKKKILQISSGKLMYDGLSKVILSLAKNCPSEKAELFVLLGKGATSEFYRILRQEELAFFQGPDRETHPFEYAVYLYRLVKRERFDVIHVHGNSATMALEMFIAVLCGVKIRIAHSHNTKTNHPIIHSILKPILGLLVACPVACGVDAGNFLFSKPFTVIPNCIETRNFAYNEKTRVFWRKKLNFEQKIVIGHVGRFRYQKNHQLLIRIFSEFNKQNENSVLLLIGTGELESEIREQVKRTKLEDKVYFYGIADNVNELMQAMDLFLLPSRYEGLSITAIEAQCAGLPTLLTDTISPETKKSNFCRFIRIDAPLSDWVSAMEFCYHNSADRYSGKNAIVSAGYDTSAIKEYVMNIWQL